MRINPVRNTSFTSVTPIIAKKGGLDKLSEKIKHADGHYYLQNATEIYKHANTNGLLGEAVREGKEVGFLVTGREHYNLLCMKEGWAGDRAPSRHINRKLVIINDKFDGKAKMLIRRIESGR